MNFSLSTPMAGVCVLVAGGQWLDVQSPLQNHVEAALETADGLIVQAHQTPTTAGSERDGGGGDAYLP